MFNNLNGDGTYLVKVYYTLLQYQSAEFYTYGDRSAEVYNILKLQRSGLEVIESISFIVPLYTVIHPNFHPTGQKIKINLSLV